MSNLFILDIKTDAEQHRAEFRLLDERDVLLAAQEISISDKQAFYWEGLFDTRGCIDRYAGNLRPGPGGAAYTEEQLLALLGLFLGREVLGETIIQLLHQGVHRRTLLIRLPDTRQDKLAAAFARVPWEIARPEENALPLLARNLAVRALGAGMQPPAREIALDPGKDEELRVLLVFAQTPDSPPLAQRLERQQLRTVFYQKILPQRRVTVDVLCHGVSRAMVSEQVRRARGYHILHWSGHGYHDSLELCRDDGGTEIISGAQLTDLLREAGGFIPSLVFLSACHSGSLIQAETWETYRKALLGEAEKPETRPDARAKTLQNSLDRKGYTGTALELLRAGVKQVIGMRYAVGDNYARRLARRFYEYLLAEGHPGDSALAMARRQLAEDPKHRDELSATDHATPLLLGGQKLVFRPAEKRSSQIKKIDPHPRQPLLLGDLRLPGHFTGREREMTLLNRTWLPHGSTPLALLQGLAGLGKTALAAEALWLWHTRFDVILAVQARPHALNAEFFYQEIDRRLALASKEYRETSNEDEYRKIFLAEDFFGQGNGRYEVMRNNLMQAMHDERILLVIDNFETCLFENRQCMDPEWTELLRAFAEELRDSASRVIVTSRHCPAVLEAECLWLRLGPLPLDEARLFLWAHPKLRTLWNAGERDLALQVLEISRGHPLIMQRFGDLADHPLLLKEALESLRQDGYARLPDLVAGPGSEAEQEAEREYLQQVSVGAADWLLQRLSVDARRLLQVLSLALEPAADWLLKTVFFNLTQRRRDAEEEDFSAFAPLHELIRTGLVQEAWQDEIFYNCHELVRERCAVWMEKNPGEQLADKTVLRAYGEAYKAIFYRLQQSGRREEATEAGRRGLTYLLRAGALDALGGFASAVVISTRDPRTLQALTAELSGAAAQAPPGEDHWRLHTVLADALRKANQPMQALPFYEQAAAEAEAARHWPHTAWICQNWANALGDAGQTVRARDTYLRAAEAHRRAGSAEVHIIGSELEAYRIDIMQDKAQQALLAVRERLDKLRAWHQQRQQGQNPDAAPNGELLERALVSALDIAKDACLSLENWQGCLEALTEIEAIMKARGEGEHEQARMRYNRYGPLLRLGRAEEAQAVLEGCLRVYQKAGDLTNQAKTLYALAHVWNERGNLSRAIELQRQALAVCERLDDPRERAISHSNLSIYLHQAGQTEEGARHRLAGMVYFVATGNQQGLGNALRNLAIDTKEATQADGNYPLPRLEALLDQPEFSVLRDFLERFGAGAGEVQQEIDGLTAQIRAGKNG
ncbi:MAG: CHAT domain-containing protein [Gammaproteobacteria bacterium]|nr:CHAT domain-containing protein [Gammaproteobacteria bacterium]